MIFSDGSYIPTFIIFSAIGIIIKCAPWNILFSIKVFRSIVTTVSVFPCLLI